MKEQARKLRHAAMKMLMAKLAAAFGTWREVAADMKRVSMSGRGAVQRGLTGAVRRHGGLLLACRRGRLPGHARGGPHVPRRPYTLRFLIWERDIHARPKQ